MNSRLETVRPVPRWLHIGAVLSVIATFILLIVGQLVTSFRAGMADPIWPTEPWYLFSNYKFDAGYLIEHSHRILGFVIGTLVAILALGLWLTESRTPPRWVAMAGMIVMVYGYGKLHKDLIAQREVSAADARIPMLDVYVTGAGIAILFAVGIFRLLGGVRGASLRLLGSAAFVAVMIQGLLGGFRVKLNELVGADLAAVHGVFAQVVLGLLVLIAVLTEPRVRLPLEQTAAKRSLGGWSIALVSLMFIQIIWGAMVRHYPTPLSQRLHFLTAFIALAASVLLLRAVFASVAARARVGFAAVAMGGLLALQLYLGVEAWMVKFGNYMLPELVPATPESLAIRTFHALVGTGLLASAVVLAARLNRRSLSDTVPSLDREEWSETAAENDRPVELAASARGELQ